MHARSLLFLIQSIKLPRGVVVVLLLRLPHAVRIFKKAENIQAVNFLHQLSKRNNLRSGEFCSFSNKLEMNLKYHTAPY